MKPPTTQHPFPSADTDSSVCDHEHIARRAEEIWRELGKPSGRDLEIWLEAEAELRATRDHVYRHPHLPGSGV